VAGLTLSLNMGKRSAGSGSIKSSIPNIRIAERIPSRIIFNSLSDRFVLRISKIF
jgi:hypothetical protein